MSTDHQATNALLAIQQELKAPKSKTNNFGNYKYRNCEDILESVKPLLAQHGATLVISDEIHEIGSTLVVTARVVFTDAQGKESIATAHAGIDVNKKGMDIAQTFGASSSYARKYALNGLFLIDDTKDYDSDEYHNQVNGKSNHRQQSAEQRQTAPQQPQAQPKKPRRTQEQLFKDALIAIKDAVDPSLLKTAVNRFKGTIYEAGITTACRARADQMGWPMQSRILQQNSNQLHH